MASWPGQPSAEQHPHLHSVSKEPERQPTAKILQARWAACAAEAEARDMSDGICLKGDSGLVRARAGKDAQRYTTWCCVNVASFSRRSSSDQVDCNQLMQTNTAAEYRASRGQLNTCLQGTSLTDLCAACFPAIPGPVSFSTVHRR